MDFILFLTITALAVSLDSMLTGFAVGLKTKFTFTFSIIVAITTFVLCALAVALGVLIDGILGDFVQIVGAAFLIIIGICNFFKTAGDEICGKLNFKECFALGFAVGLDASVANLSIALMGYTSMLIPLFFAVMHFVMVSVGFALASTPLTKKLKHTNKIAGVMLVLLGIWKLLG